ncbi:DNA polymerase delta subunit 2 [Neodiprion fabricii]|uniref:DNA polymerase delta subunit 2 n=1 Tax=Neodiprion fabricii TaxID=2872261 RepID=UPI001ED9170A|nr:DNA polymerase delta subunit 2 [Neodiprion fabricii]
MMVHATDSSDSAILLSKPSDEKPVVFERTIVEYEDLSERFKHGSKDFSRQFFHVYSIRLRALTEPLAERAKAKWGNVTIYKLADLEDAQGKRAVVIGTLYKHQELKPSILRELSEEQQLAPPTPRINYCSNKDQLFLEDEMLRIKIVGNHVNIKDMVTGIVCAVIGKENEDGTFDVEDWCFPGCVPRPAISASQNAGKLLLISGLDLANRVESMSLNLLTEWIDGMIGDPAVQREEASIVRVIIAGNSIRGSAEIHTSKGHSGGKAQDSAAAKETAFAAQRFDMFLSRIVESCCVTLMPGQFDPTNHMLPQQPLHPCILPKSARFKSLQGVTNPWVGRIGSRIVSGTSGQPIEDIMKVCDVSNVSPLVWLERTLSWRHYCPTAPDTLSSYPYYEKDPFIIEECPDIYFAGNMEKYESSLWKGEDGQTVRLICVPRFCDSGTAVLVDLDTLDAQAISFGSS